MYGSYAAHAFGVPEFRDDGDGASRRRRRSRCSSRSATACCRKCSGRHGCRRRATGPGRIASCCAAPATCSTPLAGPSRTASRSTPRANSCPHGIPADRAFVRAASPDLHQEPPRARHRRQHSPGRSGAGRGAAEGFRFRHRDRALHLSANPGQLAAKLFLERLRQDQGLQQSCRDIAIPVVDALVEKAVAAQTPGADSTITCRALDRVLRSGRYWIPHWNKASHWIAYWDQFGFRRPSRVIAHGVGAGNLVA